MLFVVFPLLLLIFYICLNFCQFDYYVSWCIPPWVYPAWDSLCFLDLVDYFLSHVWEVFRYYLFKYFLRSFLSSLSGTRIMQMLVCLMLSQMSLRLSSFHSFFYILFRGSYFHHSALQVIYLFFCLSYSAMDAF